MLNELEYIPAPLKPEWFDRKMVEIGGRTPNGKLRYRAVWGMDEKEIFDGREDIKYCSFQPGQVGMPRWIIERWIPPTLFSPAEWHTYPELGSYPVQGVHIFMFAVSDPDTGDYAPLDEMVVKRIQHDHYFLLNQTLETEVYAAQSAKREAARRKRDEQIAAETKENWKEYFAKEDYYNMERAYSFRSAPSAPPQGGKETRTPGGIILPNGVTV